MAVPSILPALVNGEISPSLYGRVDVDRARVAATTMRNMYVNYRGGAASRAGTKFVGFSKQTGRNFPPRLMTFQFSINQGLALEWGHHYMRPIFDGAFVTETAVAIGGASQADPCVLTFGATGATAATANNGAVAFSYAAGDQVTLAGGSYLTPAVLGVTSTALVSILPNSQGSNYAVNDTVTLAGGTSSIAAIARVASIAAVAARGTITFAVNPSDGDTVTLNGVTWTFKTVASGSGQTQIQPTLAGTLSQLAADVSASANASLTVATYSSTPTQLQITYGTTGPTGNAYTLAASAATRSGATLAGGTTTGIGTLAISNGGVFTANPVGALMTQASTSGGGTGASFQTAIFGPHVLSVVTPGAYSASPSDPASQASTSGSGSGATFSVTWSAAATPVFSNGDWLFVSGVAGMTELNGNIYVAGNATPASVSLFDIYGNPVDSTGFNAYTGGGTVARIFTLDTPYAEEDLPYLKVTQSADVMSICDVNQITGTEYAPQDLSRLSDTNWVFTDVIPGPSVLPPSTLHATISDSSGTTSYAYVVTAVSPVDGSESVASIIATVTGISISAQEGQVNLSWPAVADVNQYNIYKAPPSFGQPVPTGSLFGYAGTVYGTEFADANIVPDFSQVPPQHKNPFARGQVIGANIATSGTGYNQSTFATVNSATGSGAKLQTVVISGGVVAIIIVDAGSGYEPTDTITITGTGTGATAALVVGALTGTYPSVPSYFQERRAYANTINNPDTYFMSQPGAFTNFDSRIPTIDSDAIIGSPWSVQVNGIQWMVQMPAGLLVMTGLSAWLLVGAGSFATNAQPISPASQDNVPQAFIGVSPLVPPTKINYTILFVSAKGSFYYELPYQLYALSEPIDLTELSSHLFTDHTIREDAWCEQPNKLLWSVRDDGVMLSLTYYKSQQVAGWARHDTQGLFCSVCAVIEPPVDALYVATERFIDGHDAYMIERMDDRLWTSVENAWCVDCGLSLPLPTPNAKLTADTPTGLGAITGVTGLVGGSGYSAGTVVSVVDRNVLGPDGKVLFKAAGAGAVPTVTIAGGVITSITFALGSEGAGYVNPAIEIDDTAGSVGGDGASATAVLDNSATFTATAAVFGPGDVGKVIRLGGGIATVTAFIDTGNVTAQITQPITDVISTGLARTVKPQAAGRWTLATPTSTVSGLDHLIGATVVGLADGNEITPRVVSASGTVTLDSPASAVVVGLPLQAQVQGVYFESPGPPTVQGQRKKVAAANLLLEASRGAVVGASQPDGAAFTPQQSAPEWSNLTEIDPMAPPPAFNSDVVQLYTGYFRIPLPGTFDITGQVGVQQDRPFPLNLGDIVFEVLPGDTPSVNFGGQQQ